MRAGKFILNGIRLSIIGTLILPGLSSVADPQDQDVFNSIAVLAIRNILSPFLHLCVESDNKYNGCKSQLVLRPKDDEGTNPDCEYFLPCSINQDMNN